MNRTSFNPGTQGSSLLSFLCTFHISIPSHPNGISLCTNLFVPLTSNDELFCTAITFFNYKFYAHREREQDSMRERERERERKREKIRECEKEDKREISAALKSSLPCLHGSLECCHWRDFTMQTGM